MSNCGKCHKNFATRQSLSIHRKRKHPEETSKPGENKRLIAYNIVNGIVNGEKKPDNNSLKVTDMKPRIKRIKNVSKKPVVQKTTPVLTPKIKQEIVDSILKPKSLLELATEKEGIQSESADSESESESAESSTESEDSELEESESSSNDLSEPEENSEESENSDKNKYKLMPSNPKKLMKLFRELYLKFHDDVESYNNLVLMLDEMKLKKCITKDEGDALNKDLQEKMGMGLKQTFHSTKVSMTENDKKQLYHLLRSMRKDEVARKVEGLVNKYFNGEDVYEEIVNTLPTLDDKLNALRVKIILNQIKDTSNRVFQVLSRLTNTTNRIETLNTLKQQGLLTEREYEKLSIAPHTLEAISKVLEGRGIYLSKRDTNQL